MIIEIKKRAIHRTKIIEGQVKGLEKMIDSETYCIDILTQSLAIQKALASLDKLVLENHLRTHVTDMLSSGSDKVQQQAIKELLDIYELSSVRGN